MWSTWHLIVRFIISMCDNGSQPLMLHSVANSYIPTDSDIIKLVF